MSDIEKRVARLEEAVRELQRRTGKDVVYGPARKRPSSTAAPICQRCKGTQMVNAFVGNLAVCPDCTAAPDQPPPERGEDDCDLDAIWQAIHEWDGAPATTDAITDCVRDALRAAERRGEAKGLERAAKVCEEYRAEMIAMSEKRPEVPEFDSFPTAIYRCAKRIRAIKAGEEEA